MIKKSLTLFFYLIVPCAFAQTSVSGWIRVEESDEPVPYANVGISGKGIGTCADENGYFRLSGKSIQSSDTLMVSAIGYEKVMIPIGRGERVDDMNIYLKEKILNLEEVVLEGVRLKEKIVGKKGANNSWCRLAGRGGGAQFARKFEVGRKSVIIDKVHVLLTSCDSTSRLRLRIYNWDHGEKDDILNENIFLSPPKQKAEWVTVDLSDFDIKTDQDFLIGFEWLNDDFKCPMIGVGGTSPNAYFRHASHGKWIEGPFLNWAIQATLLIPDKRK